MCRNSEYKIISSKTNINMKTMTMVLSLTFVKHTCDPTCRINPQLPYILSDNILSLHSSKTKLKSKQCFLLINLAQHTIIINYMSCTIFSTKRNNGGPWSLLLMTCISKFGLDFLYIQRYHPRLITVCTYKHNEHMAQYSYMK